MTRERKPVDGPIGQLRDHFGGWKGLEKASAVSQRTWTKWARGVKPQGWNARILARLFREAGIEYPWISDTLRNLLKEYRDEQKTDHR